MGLRKAKTTSKQSEAPIQVIKEPAKDELYNCNREKLSEYFVARQIDDYCVSTQGVMPN